jgi:hypothetical protein
VNIHLKFVMRIGAGMTNVTFARGPLLCKFNAQRLPPVNGCKKSTADVTHADRCIPSAFNQFREQVHGLFQFIR